MKKVYLLVILLSALIIFFVAGNCQGKTTDLKVTFNDKGLSSVIHGEVELLDANKVMPTVQFVRFPTDDGKTEQIWEPKPKNSHLISKRKL